MKCCGQERTTRFCPECGKPTNNPLFTLLAHCKPHLDQAKTRLAWTISQNREHDEFRIAKQQASVDKWQEWMDALERAIQGDGTPEQ